MTCNEACNEAFMHKNSESIIDFNVDSQFNKLYNERNDNNTLTASNKERE